MDSCEAGLLTTLLNNGPSYFKTDHLSAALGRMKPFRARQLSAAAKSAGFEYLRERACEVGRLRRLDCALLPILFDEHWRLAKITPLQDVRIVLIDSQFERRHPTPISAAFQDSLNIFEELARLIFLDATASSTTSIRPNTKPALRNNQLQWCYLGLQSDEWSCGFWCFSFMAVLTRTFNQAVGIQDLVLRCIKTRSVGLPSIFRTWINSSKREKLLDWVLEQLSAT